MSYTTNEKVERVRALSVRMVRSGKSTREVARHFGYSQSVIVKWCKRAPKGFVKYIRTKSSAPKTHPNELPKEIVGRIIHARIKSKRCAPVLYQMLKNDGVIVSLSSIKRKIDIYGLTNKRSLWKKRRTYSPRPDAKRPGDLVEIDTIHFETKEDRTIYVYTGLDVYSRYGFATLSKKANCIQSVSFLKKLIKYFPFDIRNIQTDNGPEFGLHFRDYVTRHKMIYRHTHVRSPNENGHLERFNRTIQEEISKFGLCIFLPKDIKKYLNHYNTERLHMGINFKTPQQMLELTH